MAAPKGNNNAAIGRQGRHALELALTNFDPTKDDPYEDLEVIGAIKTLIMMWKPIITKALLEGDLMAMKEINDRLDGKPSQSITSDITIKEKDPIKRKSRIKELLSKIQT